jgi:hypothetical protein
MKRAFGISIVVLAALLLCLALIRDPARWPAPEAIPYQGEAADGAGQVHSAAALARLIREPQNAWSNLAFVIGGTLLLATRRTRGARALGIPLIAVGVGSFLYHASASAALRQLDVGAMYWLFLAAGVYCLGILLPTVQRVLETYVAGIMAATLMAAVALTLSRNVIVFGVKPFSLTVATAVSAAVLLLSVARTALRKESVSAALQLLGIVSVFGAAVYLQLGDRPGRALYRATAMIQAHAIWHVLAAGAFVWAVALLDRYATER